MVAVFKKKGVAASNKKNEKLKQQMIERSWQKR